MQRRKFLAATVAAGAGLVASATARAQFLGDPRSGAGRVLMLGGVSLEASRLALQRAHNARVREFARLEANEQTAVAAALGAQPGGIPPDPEGSAMLEQLSSLSGRQFDAQYISGQIRAHQELLQLNTANAQAGFDPVNRAVALVAVPSIQTHLQILSGLA